MPKRLLSLICLSLCLSLLSLSCQSGSDSENGGSSAGLAPTITLVPTQTLTPLPSETPNTRPTLGATWTPFPTVQIERVEPGGRSAQTELRFIHAAPSLNTAVDVYWGSRVIGARQNLGNFSAAPVRVDAGENLLRVVPTGALATEENTLFSRTLNLEADAYSALYLYDAADGLNLELYPIDLSPIEPNTVRLGLVQLANNAPMLNVRANQRDLAAALEFNQALPMGELPEGEYQIVFNAAEGVPLHIYTGRLPDRSVNTLFLIGGREGGYQSLIIQDTATPQTRIRLTHASPNSPALRLYVDNVLAVDQILFKESSDFLVFGSGFHQVRVEAVSSLVSSDALLNQRVDFTPNTQAELIIYDQLIDLKLGFFPLDTRPVIDEQSRVMLVNVLQRGISLRADSSTQILIDPLSEVENVQGLDARSTAQSEADFGRALAPFVVVGGEQIIRLQERSAVNTLQALYNTPPLELASKLLYTYIVTGREPTDAILLEWPLATLERPPPTLATLSDQRRPVRVVNALADDLLLEAYMADFSLAEPIPHGAASEPTLAPSENTLILRLVDSARGDEEILLETEVYIPLGETIVTVYVYGERADPQLFITPDPQSDLLGTRGMGFFFNSLAQRGTVTLSLIPAEGNSSALSNDPLSGISSTPIQNAIDIGNQIRYGDGALRITQSGDYILRVREVETGEEIWRAPLRIQANSLHDFILLEGESSEGETNFELIAIRRENPLDR